LTASFPLMHEVLVKERDLVMARNIVSAIEKSDSVDNESILVVCGEGHVEGLYRILSDWPASVEGVDFNTIDSVPLRNLNLGIVTGILLGIHISLIIGFSR
jgi:pheromone shutdown protein TraB